MLKKFSQFITEQAHVQTLSDDQKEFLKEFTKGKWSINPQTGLVDIQGSFDFADYEFDDLQGIEFGMVSKDFFCMSSSLKSLKGGPRFVGRNFDCSSNELESLEGAPEHVGKEFDCSYNDLISLEGGPKRVGSFYKCMKSGLESLKGAPEEVPGEFDCSDNSLTLLDGAPRRIGKNFICSYNEIMILKGGPEFVGGKYDCSNNKLFILDGLPENLNTRSLIADGNIIDEVALKGSLKLSKLYLRELREALEYKLVIPGLHLVDLE